MKGETSAIEARHFSCHIAGLGTKHDVTAHTTGSKVSDGTAQNSAVSRYGLIIKLIMDFPRKMKFFFKNECSDYGRKFN